MNMHASIGTRRLRVIASVTIFVVLVLAARSAAQTTSEAEWRNGTVLAGFAGAAASSPTTKLFAGTSLGWEIAPRLTLEGRGAWLPDHQRPTDFVAVMSAIVPLLPAERAVPFLSGGVGMYRATLDSASLDVPDFYRRRMTGSQARPVFQDLMFTMGGGAEFFATRHVAIRPEVQMFVVTAADDRRWLSVYAVNLAYHFVAHGIR